MQIINEVRQMLWREFRSEFKFKAGLQGLALYVAGAALTAYFGVGAKGIRPLTFNAIFLLTMLFSAINATTRSFLGERRERMAFFASLCSPEAFILAKMIYNITVLLLLNILGFILFVIFLGNPALSNSIYFSCISLGAIGYGTAFTLVAAIAQRADGGAALSATLSFPVALPFIILHGKLTSTALSTDSFSTLGGSLYPFLALIIISAVLALALYRFLWKI